MKNYKRGYAEEFMFQKVKNDVNPKWRAKKVKMYRIMYLILAHFEGRFCFNQIYKIYGNKDL